jgi:hypothetical protein
MSLRPSKIDSKATPRFSSMISRFSCYLDDRFINKLAKPVPTNMNIRSHASIPAPPDALVPSSAKLGNLELCDYDAHATDDEAVMDKEICQIILRSKLRRQQKSSPDSRWLPRALLCTKRQNTHNTERPTQLLMFLSKWVGMIRLQQVYKICLWGWLDYHKRMLLER